MKIPPLLNVDIIYYVVYFALMCWRTQKKYLPSACRATLRFTGLEYSLIDAECVFVLLDDVIFNIATKQFFYKCPIF